MGSGGSSDAARQQTAQVQAQENARVAIAHQHAATERLRLQKQEAERLRALKDKQYAREHTMKLQKIQNEEANRQRQMQAERERKQQEHTQRLKQMQIDAAERDKNKRIQQKNEALSRVNNEVNKLDVLIENDGAQLETEKKDLENISKQYDVVQGWIDKFGSYKQMELDKTSDKLQLETAKQSFENDDKQIKSAINACGQVEGEVGKFLSLTHCLLGATIATTAHSNKLDAEISTFGELISRECQDKLSIEQYFHQKNLARFVPILEKEEFIAVDDLKCEDDEEYEEILTLVETGIKKAIEVEDDSDNDDDKEEKEAIEGKELVKQLLTSWGLDQYYDVMIDEGYEDVVDWNDLTTDDLKNDMGFRGGHVKKFMRKYKEWRSENKILSLKEQRLLNEICRQPETWEQYEVEQRQAAKEGLMSISPLLSEFFTRIHKGIKHTQEILNYEIELNSAQRNAIKMVNELPPMNAIEYKNNDDNDEDESKNDVDDDEDDIFDDIRKEWKIHSKVQIYSESSSKWCDGVVYDITNDDEGEWLHIKYTVNNRLKLTKEIQRASPVIRALVDNTDNNRTLALQCRALTQASIISIDVTDSMMDAFNENVLTTRALSVARGVEDCCMQIIKSQSTIRQSVLLAQEILKYRPAHMSDEAKVLWKAVDDGVIRIFKTAINMVKISSQYFGYFLRFKQGFQYYESNKDKTFMISLQYLHKDIRDFTKFKKNFAKTVQELSNEAMECIKNCVVTSVGAVNFEKARSSRERTLKKWLDKKAIYDKHSLELDYELDKKQQEKIIVSAEKARLTYKVAMLEGAIKNHQDYKRDYMAMKDVLNKQII